MAITQEQYNEKIALYKKVFYILLALTVFEGVIILMKLPTLLQTSLIVVASLAKAVYVGWYFMHLNHESKWLVSLVFMPVVMIFGYTVVLVTDAVFRPASPYAQEPERKFGARLQEDLPRDDFGRPLLPTSEELQEGADSESNANP